MRYNNIDIIKTPEGKRYYKTVIYPQIDPQNTDIYITTNAGDRLDILAHVYYGDVYLWWVLSSANNIPHDTLYPPPGTQLRIPDAQDYIDKFDQLNLIR